MTPATPPPEPWPELVRVEIEPTATHLHRIAQIGGKLAMFAPFEPNWGNITLRLNPRGFATATLYEGDVAYEVRYDVLDDRVTVAASTGTISLPLGAGSVAEFYARFVAATAPLGVPAPKTTIEAEIEGAPHLDADVEPRPYDSAAARRVWAAYASASRALERWQASYVGQRPPVGIMWGGFDLAATRFRGTPKRAESERPVFMRNSMVQEEVAVGFGLGDATYPAAFYAYVLPALDAFASADFGPGARYVPAAGLATVSYETIRTSADPEAAVVAFADAVYAVAEAAGWPADSRDRRDGWNASRELRF